MVRQLSLFLVLSVLAIFLIPTVFAEVWFVSQPEPIYSIGDELKTYISVSYLREQLKAELSCVDESKFIFLKFLVNESTVEILQPLTKSFLQNAKGRCKIVLEYGGDSAESSDFLISDSVFLEAGIEKQSYAPGEEIIIRGKAEKINNKLLEGFFELSFSKINLVTTGSVKNGKFETNITLPEGTAAGNYLIEIKAYEKEGEEITNIGETKLIANVKQVPKKIDFALNSQSIKPGNNLEFKVILYDQSEGTIEGEASFVIENSKEEPLLKSLTKIGKSESFSVEKNLSLGEYKIKAYSSGIYGERQFYVEENEEVEFKIIDGTLIVKNIGNVKYDNAIQVEIDDTVEIINDEIEAGEEKKYGLLAPEGDYDIIITDGKTSLNSRGVGLTGGVIAIKEMEKSFFARNKVLAWLFLIFVMGMFIFVSGRRVLKKKFVLFDKPLIGKRKETKGVIKAGEDKGIVVIKAPREAEHSLVLKGQKQETPLICLKIKNELSKVARENLDKVIEKVYEKKGVVYKSGEYTISIFSPLITRTFKNYVPAIKTAQDIAKALQDYNKKFRDKIDFGIAVHNGNIVSVVEQNKLKFTSLGNTLTLAKRLAELSQKEVLLSKEIHEKTLADVKADKLNIQGFEVYTIKRVADVERNEKFISEFLKRQEEEKRRGIGI